MIEADSALINVRYRAGFLIGVLGVFREKQILKGRQFSNREV
jgi:hypothetical protein